MLALAAVGGAMAADKPPHVIMLLADGQLSHLTRPLDRTLPPAPRTDQIRGIFILFSCACRLARNRGETGRMGGGGGGVDRGFGAGTAIAAW